jgi:hypothetical protein
MRSLHIAEQVRPFPRSSKRPALIQDCDPQKPDPTNILFWRWKSKPQGRPRLPADLRQLIGRMATANPMGRGADYRRTIVEVGNSIYHRAQCGNGCR